MTLPIRYGDDRVTAEQILLNAGKRHALGPDSLGAEEAQRLQERYGIQLGDVEPRVFWRLTDNWLELSLRFLVRDHGSREVKDAISRDLLAALDDAGIGLASGTYEIVGMPPLQIQAAPATVTHRSGGS
jgi:hypothetical protein